MTKDTGSILAEEDPLLNWMWDVMERGNQGDILGPPPTFELPITLMLGYQVNGGTNYCDGGKQEKKNKGDFFWRFGGVWPGPQCLGSISVQMVGKARGLAKKNQVVQIQGTTGLKAGSRHMPAFRNEQSRSTEKSKEFKSLRKATESRVLKMKKKKSPETVSDQRANCLRVQVNQVSSENPSSDMAMLGSAGR